jgi:tetratricopeptide (TPR) repeat protein
MCSLNQVGSAAATGGMTRKALGMYRVGIHRDALSLPRMIVPMLLSAAILAAQNRVPVRHAATEYASPMPRSCLTRSSDSEKISALLETIHEHPTAGAYNTLGVLYAQADRVACAIPSFEAALRLDRQNWESHYNLALALLRRGNEREAKRELETAIQQKPDAVSSHFALGTLLEGDRKLAQAEEEFRSTLKIDPGFIPGSLKLSDVLIAEGRPQAAVACLESAIKQAPPDQAEPLKAGLGIAYAENGDMERGLTTLKDLAASRPDSAEAHLRLGLLFARRGEPPDQQAAVTEFGHALQLDRSMDAARIALGRALVSSGNYPDAIPVLLEYTRRQPKDAQGFYNLAQAYAGIRRSGLAIGAFRKAADLDPTNAAIRSSLGAGLAGRGEMAEAIRQFEAAERINSSDPETHAQLALLFEKIGDREHARAEHRKLAALKSSRDRENAAATLNQRANQSLSAGNAEAAVESYRQALELTPRVAKLHYNLSLAFDRLGNFSFERKELETALELDHNLAPAENQLGLLGLREARPAEAEQHFKKALALDPRFAEAQSSLGVLYSQQGKTEQAVSLFQQAIQNDPKYTKAYVNLGLLLAQRGDFSEAEPQFRTAIQIDPAYADAYAALGMLQAKTGHGSEAVQYFEKAVALGPNSAQAHLNLGIALVDQFDRAGGLREFSEAARLDPNFAAAHYNLGRFFFETGKYQDASRELETANRLQPDYADALYFLALAARQQNQLTRSTELLERVVALEPGNADAQYLLGQNLEHSGDTTAAIQHWKMAVKADPNHAQALFNLAKFLGKLDEAEAKQYQQRFDALQKEHQITDRVAELGNFALEAASAQNWPQAFEQMNEAIQLCGDCSQSAHLHKNLGLFHLRTGNIGAADKELRTALQLTPSDSDVQNALAAVERARAAAVR